MKKILMCGYYGMCDSSGKSVGHTAKVTEEYFELLITRHKVSILGSPSVISSLPDRMYNYCSKLKYDIVIDVPFTFIKRVLDKFKIMYNAHVCCNQKGYDTLFFYQVDFFFFFYLWLFYKKKKQEIYCLIYHQDFTGGKVEGILQWIYNQALKKISGVVYTQRRLEINHPKSLYIPDYFYQEEKYGKYRVLDKKEKVVCLGTMNRYKKIEELVGVFSKINYELEICGKFDDIDRFQNLLELRKENIKINNQVLSIEDYYKKMGEAKYSILPYDMNQYNNRTSGVLLETLYVGSIPIAPKTLLEQNELPGFGYEKMEEVIDYLNNPYLDNSIIEKSVYIREINSKKIMEQSLGNFFEG